MKKYEIEVHYTVTLEERDFQGVLKEAEELGFGFGDGPGPECIVRRFFVSIGVNGTSGFAVKGCVPKYKDYLERS